MKIIIIGAGISGICMGIKLKNRGIHDFLILEKNDEVGGTWYLNHYPGVECDIESHLYSFSFYLNPKWTHKFASGAEIQNYLKSCCQHFNLYSHIRFNHQVTQIEHIDHQWKVRTDQDEFSCQYLVCSFSPLHTPNIPNIKGLSRFKGPVLHTSSWKNIDWKDKKIAIIGNAASGIQCIPILAKTCQELFIFQRTPNWILPKKNRRMYDVEKFLLKNQWIHKIYRNMLFWYHELGLFVFYKNNIFQKIMRKYCISYIRSIIIDRELQKKLLPPYPIGCKRILLSDDYYQCLNQKNVNVITDPIEYISENSVNNKKVDMIVLATGFQIEGSIQKLNICVLETLYGVHINQIKNLFLLLGPNSGSAHNSIISYIESQVNHIIDCIQTKKIIKFDQHIFQKEDIFLQKRFPRFVWDSCSNWYIHYSKNKALFPGFTFEFLYRKPKLS